MQINDIEGQIVKEDDRYIVKDNTSLNNLVISTTTLHPDKSTSGHKHEGQEEDRKSTRLNSSHYHRSRMPSSA